MGTAWTCRSRVSVTNPPGFPTALVYPRWEIRSEELGTIPKHTAKSTNHQSLPNDNPTPWASRTNPDKSMQT